MKYLIYDLQQKSRPKIQLNPKQKDFFHFNICFGTASIQGK